MFSNASTKGDIIQDGSERCGQILGTSSTFQNEKKMSISTYVRKHLICEVPLGCQQELRTLGGLGVPTGKNPEDSNLVRVEAMRLATNYTSYNYTFTYNTQHI
jgi:hypothetical protein